MNDEHVDALIMIIGMRLKNLRGDANQEDAAERAGIHRSKYSAVERGRTHYRIDAFIRVLVSYGIDILALFEPRPENQTEAEKPSAVIELALEQLRTVLLEGGEISEGALFNVGRWFESLPPKRQS